jgi:glyoxalase family protein
MEPLNGMHHVTGVTNDPVATVDFWCRILGLRFVKKTLNFETTFRYHLYFGDEEAGRGSIVTFLEWKELERGRSGRGTIQSIVLRVASSEALEWWWDRMTSEQVFTERVRLDPSQPDRLLFEDPIGHAVELMVSDAPDRPLVADADDIPEAYRIRGIDGPRSYADPDDVEAFLAHMGYERTAHDLYEQRGADRTARWRFTRPPSWDGEFGAAGVWHHVAVDVGDEMNAWRDFAHSGPIPFTPPFDHYYFESSVAQTPAGMLELCGTGPGFLIDQAIEDLGDHLTLSPRVEPLRAKLERELTPLVNPRPRGKATAKRRSGAGGANGAKAAAEADGGAAAHDEPAAAGTA